MSTKFHKLWCVILSLAILINLLPAGALAAEAPMEQAVVQHWVEDPPVDETEATQSLEIVSEDISKRGEYYKEFVLTNGLRMASMYAEPVHYSEGGQWKEIDNTLKLANGAYTNTAGKWQVSFPQQLTKDKAVTINKGGYTLSFFMAGELYRDTASLTKASLGTATQEQPVQLQSFQTATAQLQTVKQSEPREETQYPQAPAEKSHARLKYANVSTGTDIVYDLNSNQVKESIVMEAYSARLQGYRYTLNVGELNPVLTDSGEIHLYDRDSKEIVMVMPAPFLVDDAGEYCYDVELTLTGKGSQYTLTYLLPQQWLADPERQWPVILDPVVQADITRTNIRDVSVYERNGTSDNNYKYLDVGYDPEYGVMRSYIKYAELPKINSADVIVNAQLTLTNASGSTVNCIVEACKVLETWESESTTWSTKPGIDTSVEDYVIVNSAAESALYYMDITDIVRGWYDGENTGFALKVPKLVETSAFSESYKTQFFSADFIEPLRPQLTVYFRNTSGLENYWDYTVSSAGRAGTGYVNNYSGNLVWVHCDMGYGGNRMPVSISHIYNSNDKAESTFGAGYGWRTNYNQTLKYYSVEDGDPYYIWEDADGTEHCFNKNDAGVYEDEDGLQLTLTQDDELCICMIKDKEGNTYYFDYYGRLYMLKNNQEESSSIQIDYTTSNGTLISKITDGVGRVYRFDYNGGFITKIRYLGTESNTDSENDSIDYVNYEYSNGCLTKITYRDGETSLFTYSNNHALLTAQDIDGYKLTYTYTTVAEGSPWRVGSIQEAAGGLILFYYYYNQTKLLDNLSNTQIKQFNSWGNLLSVQDSEGRSQFADYDSNDQLDQGVGNRLITSSKMQNTVSNLLNDSSFENYTLWGTPSGVNRVPDSTTSYHGNIALNVINGLSDTDAGVRSGSFYANPGETYTFSAYVKTGSSGSAYIGLGEDSSPELSEALAPGQDWTRLQVTYTNHRNTVMLFAARVFCTPGSSVYVDCVQLEKAETASRYNLVENGDFRYGLDSWSKSEDCDSGEGVFTTQEVAAPMLSNTVFKMSASPYEELRLQQTVDVRGNAGDTFVLGGWAQGNSVPLTYEYRSFSLRGTFIYTDQSSESSEFVFDYNSSTNNWQYTSGAMVAEKDYSGIKVELLYEYNANDAYFNGIQLFKEEFGSSYTYDGDGNVISVRDLQGKLTKYEYANNNPDLLRVIQDNKAKVTYEYDNWHNVTKATTAEGVIYEFTYDTYGNNTSVSITSGDQTITSTATYSTDGNRLVSTTDTLGKITTYSYHPDTNVLEWVQYPQDTAETRTEYTYDDMYRIAQAAVTTNTGLNLSAEYTYDDDLLTSIETASTTYNFTYGDFALRSSVMVGNRKLADYSYYSISHQLEKLAYGNNGMVEYTYDKQGRVTQQTYETGAYVTYKYDNSGALAKVYDSQSGTTTAYYYDFTDRMMKYVEKSSTGTHSVGYEYDDINNLTALVEMIGTVERETSYTYDEDNRPISVTTEGNSRSYTYDASGRVSADETKQDSSVLFTRSYNYQSTSGGGTSGLLYSLSYASDNFSRNFVAPRNSSGNIAYTMDGTYTNTYRYDSANQLIQENNRVANTTTLWTYDNAGNILKREVYPRCTGTPDPATKISEVIYTYGDSDWGDLLTAYNGVPITYDGIGNPLNDGTWTYTWQHGSQLASMAKIGTTETWQFTYNADGLRTQRKNTNANITYNYTYLGGQLTHMTVGGHTMYFAYDASDHPLTLTYNGTTYYYVTNLQGDVVAILNSSGTQVVRYAYDAWGNLISTTCDEGFTDLGFYNPLRYRSYVYDEETELYYVSSRYYDPEIGRWISADAFTSTGQGIIGNNMFAYCGNNPVARVDIGGYFWDTVFDAASLFFSIVDVVKNPKDKWAWLGLAGDVVDLLPFVTGVGETVKAARVVNKVVDGFGGLSKAKDFGIKSYNSLRKILKGTGLEAHHIIEKRLVKYLGIDVNSMLSVAVTVDEHREFTKAWRKAFKYGTNYRNITRNDIWKAAQDIYKDYPDLLDAAKKTLFG